ncbi:MAG: hypothetical protein KGP14_00425 [Betaproteobacteria bacterium]|nr:hypothetical protein [Betaproteobacteria bacterium]
MILDLVRSYRDFGEVLREPKKRSDRKYLVICAHFDWGYLVITKWPVELVEALKVRLDQIFDLFSEGWGRGGHRATGEPNGLFEWLPTRMLRLDCRSAKAGDERRSISLGFDRKKRTRQIKVWPIFAELEPKAAQETHCQDGLAERIVILIGLEKSLKCSDLAEREAQGVMLI